MKKITMHPSLRSVDCAPGDTVLMALEKAGYALPNNCRAGACGECKIKVLHGEYDQGVVLDMALSEEDRANGFGLMCMAKPVSDEMIIEWGSEDAKPKLFPPRENVLSVVIDKRLIGQRVMEVRLRTVGPSLRFWPGQYITLGHAGQGVPYRAYSIASAPSSDGEIVLQVALSDSTENNSTSSWVHHSLSIGESVKINGPYGTFIGDPAMDNPVLCLAAGTGLAPLFSLTEAALRRGYRKPVTLIFSARTEEDVYGYGMLKWWHTKHRNFDFKISLTREEKTGYLHGRIADVLPALLPDLSKHYIFAAGSPDFVEHCRKTVLSLNANSANIYTEGFFDQQDQNTPT